MGFTKYNHLKSCIRYANALLSVIIFILISRGQQPHTVWCKINESVRLFFDTTKVKQNKKRLLPWKRLHLPVVKSTIKGEFKVRNEKPLCWDIKLGNKLGNSFFQNVSSLFFMFQTSLCPTIKVLLFLLFSLLGDQTHNYFTYKY